MAEKGNSTVRARGELAFRLVCVLTAILLGVLAVRVFSHWGKDDLQPIDLSGGVTNGVASVAAPSAVSVTNKVPVVTVPPPVVTNAPVVRPALVAPVTNAPPPVVHTRTYPTNVPPARQVRLANRTRVVEKYRRAVPKKFAARQTPTVRGTAPYVVVSELPVSDLVRARATKLGACVLGYLPVNALLVEVDEQALKRLTSDVLFTSVYELEPVDKVQRRVWEQTTTASTVDIAILPVAPSDLATLRTFIESKGGRLVGGAGDETRTLRATVPAKVVDELAGRGEVRWIESFARPKLQNNRAVDAGEMNVREVWDTHGLTGEGQIVSISDSGLDTGNVSTLMQDFKGRVLGIRNVSQRSGWSVFTTKKDDVFGHGTHTAGSIVGTGALSNGEIRGVAHQAKLFVTGVVGEDGYVYFTSFSSLFQPSSSYSAAIHSASWGDDRDNSYSDWCWEVDDYVWKHPTFLPVFSAGNTGTNAQTVGTPGTAKNCLTVGATESLRSATEVSIPYHSDNAAQIAYFSSCGPTEDGRIKPEVCAPGTYILSTKSTRAPDQKFDWGLYAANTNYAYMGGTSMACPLVAGAAALTRQWLTTQRGYGQTIPTAALIKAVLTGGAHDLASESGTNCGGAAPNHRQGWGRIDLAGALFPSNRVVRLRDRIPFATGSDEVVRVTVTNAAPFEVQLVWIDYPATAGAATALVNDLDLVVSNETTGVVWWGNGVTGGDRTNTLESVRLAQATPGTYAVHVKGVQVPYDSTTGGAAALYLRGAFADEHEVVATEFPLNLKSYFPLLDDWGSTETHWYPSGTVVRVSVPDDLPDGAETLSNLVWTDDETGEETPLDDQVLAEIDVGTAGQAGVLQYDARGQMAREFDVTMDCAKDVRFHYYSVTNINPMAGLPDWWWRRLVRGAAGDGAAGWAAGDVDGDGVSNLAEYQADTDPLDVHSQLRILAFTPTNIVWRGGRACTQVVERAEKLAKDAVWTGVYTNLPPTEIEVRRPVTPAGTRSFYRVRVFGR